MWKLCLWLRLLIEFPPIPILLLTSLNPKVTIDHSGLLYSGHLVIWSSSLTRWPSQSGKETNFEVILFLECSQFYNIPFRQLPDPLTSTSQMSPLLPYYITSSNIIPIWEKTSQELRMLSHVALYWRINMNAEIVVFNCHKSVSQRSGLYLCHCHCLHLSLYISLHPNS